MLSLKLEWDEAQVLRIARTEKKLTRAVAWAGRDAIRAVRTDTQRTVRSKKALKVSRVNRALSLRFPRSTRSLEDLEWRMRVSAEPVPAVDYPHRQTKKGVTVQINRGRRTMIVSAFLATMRSGHRGIFQRVGKARTPIREVFTTRVSDVVRDTGVPEALFARGQATFQATFKRVLPLELRKR